MNDVRCYDPQRCVVCGKLRIEDWDVLIEPDCGLCFDCLEECQAGTRCWDCLEVPCACNGEDWADGQSSPALRAPETVGLHD
jgi:hypothetical protein